MSTAQLETLVAQTLAGLESAAPAAWQPLRIDTPAALARLIDHTLLKPETTEDQVRALCAEALQFNFASVCVNPTWAPLCVELLAESPIKTCTVIGFPLGATLPAVKAYEVEQVAQLGVQEVDMVLPVGRLRDGDYRAVERDIAAVADAAQEHGLLLKVILETGLLTHEQKVAACVIAEAAGANFVKTATGFSGGGATAADIALMRRVVGSRLGVKASGGIRTAADALSMVAAGADRIGASAGVRIMQEMAGVGAGEDGQTGAY